MKKVFILTGEPSGDKLASTVISLKGVVLKSKKNIFLDRNKCISFANKNKIFIKII